MVAPVLIPVLIVTAVVVLCLVKPSLFEPSLNWAGKLFTGVWDFLRGLFGKIGLLLGTLGDGMGTFFGWVWSALQFAWKIFCGLWKAVCWIGSLLWGLIKLIPQIFHDLFEVLGSLCKIAW